MRFDRIKLRRPFSKTPKIVLGSLLEKQPEDHPEATDV